MKLTDYGIISLKEWIHDPNIKDKYNYTVSYYLKYSCFPVPNEWYDEEMKNTPKNPEFV